MAPPIAKIPQLPRDEEQEDGSGQPRRQRDCASHIESVHKALGQAAFDKACQEGTQLTDTALDALVEKLVHFC